MNKHTFVICAYKESPYLEKCIESLMRQTKKSNILMVTSTPNKYIEEIAKKYDIPLYVNENGGITQDWNFAYDHAETEYVTIAHQDDVYFSKYVEKVIYDMEKAKKPIIWFSDYAEIRDGHVVKRNKLLLIKRLMLFLLIFKPFQSLKCIRRFVLSLGCPICCPSVTFYKNRIKNGPFQHGFRSDEDWEAWEKLSHMKGQFVYHNEILVGHRIHEDSETSNILQDDARSKEDYIMFQKFWPNRIAKMLAKLYSVSENSNNLS